MKCPYYPIIYIRGYAMTQGAVEDTVADLYMGFDMGSTKSLEPVLKPTKSESALLISWR